MPTHTPAAAIPPPWRSALEVALLIGLATGLGLALEPLISLTSQAMLFVLAVVLAAYRLAPLPAFLCAVAAVNAFNFFFVPPRWTFEVEGHEHLIALFTLAVVALTVSHLVTRLRAEAARAHLLAQHAQQLQSLASALALAASPEDAVQAGQAALDQAFDGPNILCTAAQLDATLPAQAAPYADGLRRCVKDEALLGPGTGRWPGLNAWYVPLGSRGNTQGAACIAKVQADDDTGREHASALCTLIGQALWRLKLLHGMEQERAAREREQIQSTFLAAISHDLRTPLANVVGAASALLEQGGKLPQEHQQEMLASIVREATHLSHITENTLQLVQLRNASTAARWDWESMEEIIGGVLGRIASEQERTRVHTELSRPLPLIQGDAVLLSQLLSNLIDNALKYSTAEVTVHAHVHEGQLRVQVKDRGQTLAPQAHAVIFEPYARNDGTGRRGAGLGLALCRAIAQLHRASIELRPRRGGGNCFVLTLPIPLQAPSQPPAEPPA